MRKQAQRSEAICPKTHSESTSETALFFFLALVTIQHCIIGLLDDFWVLFLIECKHDEGRGLAQSLYWEAVECGGQELEL